MAKALHSWGMALHFRYVLLCNMDIPSSSPTLFKLLKLLKLLITILPYTTIRLPFLASVLVASRKNGYAILFSRCINVCQKRI